MNLGKGQVGMNRWMNGRWTVAYVFHLYRIFNKHRDGIQYTSMRVSSDFPVVIYSYLACQQLAECWNRLRHGVCRCLQGDLSEKL